MPATTAGKLKLSYPRSATIAIVAVAVCLGVGCRSPKYYSAASLPQNLQAPHIESAQTVDLSQFAGTPVSHDLIDRGDVLKVSIAAGLDAAAVTTLMVRIGDDGSAMLPEIGQIPLAGLELMEAEHQIAAACVHRQLYRQPHVTVSMERQRVNRITVVGGVAQPGAYRLPRASSYLLAAIVSAGGLADDAGTQVEIRQPATPTRMADAPADGVQLASHSETTMPGGEQRVCLNLADATSNTRGGQYLEDGAVVTVERRVHEPVQVIGLVKQPGRYAYSVDYEMRLFGAIAEAGGVSSDLADKVLIFRRDPRTQQVATIRVSLNEAKQNPEENVRLAPGDVVTVEHTAVTMITDTLGKLVRFGMSASMPVF